MRTAYEILINNIPKDKCLRFFYIHSKKYDKKAYDFYFGIGNLIKKIEPYIKKHKIEWKGLVNQDDFGYRLADKFPKYMPVKYVSFPLPGNMDIGEEITLITVWSEKPIAILIRSQEIADNYKNYFESAWKVAK